MSLFDIPVKNHQSQWIHISFLWSHLIMCRMPFTATAYNRNKQNQGTFLISVLCGCQFLCNEYFTDFSTNTPFTNWNKLLLLNIKFLQHLGIAFQWLQLVMDKWLMVINNGVLCNERNNYRSWKPTLVSKFWGKNTALISLSPSHSNQNLILFSSYCTS